MPVKIERRRGGETGVKAVQCLVDDAVWQAGKQGVFDRKLLAAALSRLERPPDLGRPLRERVRHPVLNPSCKGGSGCPRSAS